MGATSRILRDLLQSEVEDVPGGRLDRAVEALGVFRHHIPGPVVLVRLNVPPPTENTPSSPVALGPVTALPVIEGGEGLPEGLPILYRLLTGEFLLRVFVDVEPVLLDAEAIQEAQGRPLGGRPSLHRPLLADQLGRGPEVDVLPIRERLEHGAVLGVIGGYPELLLGEVAPDDHPARGGADDV